MPTHQVRGGTLHGRTAIKLCVTTNSTTCPPAYRVYYICFVFALVQQLNRISCGKGEVFKSNASVMCIRNEQVNLDADDVTHYSKSRFRSNGLFRSLGISMALSRSMWYHQRIEHRVNGDVTSMALLDFDRPLNITTRISLIVARTRQYYR